MAASRRQSPPRPTSKMAVDLGTGGSGDRRSRALARRDDRGPSPIGEGPLTCAGRGIARCDKLRPMPRTDGLPSGIRLALVVLALVITRPVAAHAGVFGIHISPTHFSPNADGVQDR